MSMFKDGGIGGGAFADNISQQQQAGFLGHHTHSVSPSPSPYDIEMQKRATYEAAMREGAGMVASAKKQDKKLLLLP